jgi:hypothetical protein
MTGPLQSNNQLLNFIQLAGVSREPGHVLRQTICRVVRVEDVCCLAIARMAVAVVVSVRTVIVLY